MEDQETSPPRRKRGTEETLRCVLLSSVVERVSAALTPLSVNDDGADHAGMNGAVVVKRPGGRERDRELTTRRHDSRIPDAGIRRRRVRDAIGVRPRHR